MHIECIISPSLIVLDSLLDCSVQIKAKMMICVKLRANVFIFGLKWTMNPIHQPKCKSALFCNVLLCYFPANGCVPDCIWVARTRGLVDVSWIVWIIEDIQPEPLIFGDEKRNITPINDTRTTLFHFFRLKVFLQRKHMDATGL